MVGKNEVLVAVVWWCFMCSVCLGYEPSHGDQCYDLYQFRQSISYNENSKVASWDLDTDCCSWNGVTCHTTTGNVTGLHLDRSSLYGKINSSSTLFRLVHLQILNLNYNNFSASEIPSGFSHLSSLTHLDLSNNHFSGHIPFSFEHFGKLEYLHLSRNNFSGPIPPLKSPSNTIRSIDLSKNQFTGPIPYSYVNGLPNLSNLELQENSISGEIPASLFMLPSLKVLLLDGNHLNGELKELPEASSFSSLHQIDLSNNELQGPIPSSLFKIRNIGALYMHSNNFSGILDPHLFENMRNLSFLNLSNNTRLTIDASVSISQMPYLAGFRFSNCNLSGFPELLRNQDQLWEVDISMNRIQGQIPNWLWTKKRLTLLNLSHNFFHDFERPLTNLSSSNLIHLALQYNSIQGSLPSFPESLFTLSISHNKFTGKIPQSICDISGVSHLDLSHNQMMGSIPPCFANFSMELNILDMQGNKFHGNIPQNFPKTCNLKIFSLSNNQLEGRVPRSLAHCTHLQVLDIGNNHIKDTFPYWMESITELQVLILRYNRFHGVLMDPIIRTPFPKLHIIDLSNNHFVGRLPSKYFQHWNVMMRAIGMGYKLEQLSNPFYLYSTAVTNKGQIMQYSTIISLVNVVDMSNNRFEGEIPQSISCLKSLMVLNLSQNSLTGEIPSAMSNITALQSLDLSQNKLFGEIPSDLTDLTYLEFLNLSYNFLVGRIPTKGQFSTFTASSFEGNAGLCGYQLSNSCEQHIHGQPPMQHYFQAKSKNGMIWISTFIGYGSGLVIWVLIEHFIVWRNLFTR